MQSAVWLLLALVVPTIYAQSCTVDKELNFPNLNLCGTMQSDFCERLTTVEDAATRICNNTKEALCERILELETAVSAPRMVCGVPEQEFCAANAMSQSDQEAPSVVNPAEIMCLASPLGEIRFFKTDVDCPCGFTDVTNDYRDRFVSIGDAGTTIGTSGESLATRSRIINSNIPSPTFDGMVRTDFGGTPVDYIRAPASSLTITGSLATADIAPSLSLKVCERQGPCACDA